MCRASSSGKDKFLPGEKVGIGVGILAGILLIVMGLYCYLIRPRFFMGDGREDTEVRGSLFSSLLSVDLAVSMRTVTTASEHQGHCPRI